MSAKLARLTPVHERKVHSPLDAPEAESKRALYAGAALALVGHVLVGAVALSVQPVREVLRPSSPPQVSELVEVDLPPEPAPQVEEPSAPAPPPLLAKAPKAAPAGPKAEAAEPLKAAEPPPAAAQAAQVLTQADDAPVDFGDTFVQGTGTRYAGGVTQAGGTSSVAVRDTNARAGGVPGGKGTGEGGRCVPQPPKLADGVYWDCPTPEEAQAEGIESAVVTLDVTVASDGSVTAVNVTKDPGSGFGREARRCAMRKRWQPGRDCTGKAMAARSLINVRFEAR